MNRALTHNWSIGLSVASFEEKYGSKGLILRVSSQPRFIELIYLRGATETCQFIFDIRSDPRFIEFIFASRS
jgi:hypothetical protein